MANTWWARDWLTLEAALPAKESMEGCSVVEKRTHKVAREKRIDDRWRWRSASRRWRSRHGD